MATDKSTPFFFLKRCIRKRNGVLFLFLMQSVMASEHGAPPAAEHGEKAGHEAAHEASHESTQDSDHMAEHSARTSSRDVAVPRALVSHVEKAYEDFLKKEGVLGKPPITRKLLNVRVELSQSKRSALHENSRVNTPLGGGVVDLAEMVTQVKGAFSAKINVLAEDGSTPSNAKVYYVSRAKARAIGSENFGAGCNRWMEITSFFSKAMSRGGFQLYTADQRYVSVLGGTFVIVSFAKEALSVGSVSFTDSRYSHLLCEDNEKVH